MSDLPAPKILLVDSHAHFYAHFQPDGYLDAAFNNLSAAVPVRYKDAVAQFCLIMTSATGELGFDHLFDIAHSTQPDFGGWTLTPTQDNISLCATQGARQIILLAGAQMASAEALEVSYLGTRVRLDDGISAQQMLDYAAAQELFAVIPWGAGKWLLDRATLLNELLEQNRNLNFAVGDSACRPGIWPLPSQLSLARSCQKKVLSGSDPLPLAHDWQRVGSLASAYADVNLDPSKPGHSILACISTRDAQEPITGRRVSALRFGMDQVKMRL